MPLKRLAFFDDFCSLPLDDQERVARFVSDLRAASQLARKNEAGLATGASDQRISDRPHPTTQPLSWPQRSESMG